MKVEDLKNYGKPLSDIILDPKNVKHGKRMSRTVFGELRRDIGLIGTMKLVLRARKEGTRMKRHHWSSIREHRLLNQGFLDYIIKQMAAAKAMADIVGMERASEIYLRLIDQIGYEISAQGFPSPDDFQACGNAFESFKKYAKSLIEADIRAGIHEIEIVEDSPNTFAYNVKYCVWNEVAKEFGIASLGYSARCYADEVFFNKAMPQQGIRYQRTGTLATGAPACDVRFELIARE